MTGTLNFKFSVILITLKANEQSHTWLAALVELDSVGRRLWPSRLFCFQFWVFYKASKG